MLQLSITLVGENHEVLAEYLEEFAKELLRLKDLFKGTYGYKTIDNGMINYECEMQRLK